MHTEAVGHVGISRISVVWQEQRLKSNDEIKYCLDSVLSSTSLPSLKCNLRWPLRSVYPEMIESSRSDACRFHVVPFKLA